MRYLLIVLVTAALAAQTAEPPAPAAESWLTGNVDFGYRWHNDVAGNFNSYRSIVNLGEGPKLLGTDFTIRNPARYYFDTLTVTAHGWGGDPYTSTRVDVSRRDTYRLTADYRRMALFDFLPSYANPLLASGVSMNQHSLDTRRRSTDIQLDLVPGRRVVPYLGFRRNAGSGSGITDFYTDGNEYPVRNQLRDSTTEYRGGVRFEFDRFHVTFEQGGHTSKDDQLATDAQLTYGNRLTAILGQNQDLTSLNQAYGVRGDAVYTKLLFTASPTSWANVFGQLLYSRLHSTVHYSENAAGNFLLLSALTFYSGESNTLTAGARLPHTSGSAGVEVRPLRRLRVVESWMTDRASNDNSIPIYTLILSGKSFSQTSTGGVTGFILNNDLTYNYNQNQVDAFFDLTRKLTLRGGYRRVWGDAEFRAPQLSYTDMESGRLSRHVGLAGLQFRAGQKFSFNTDFEAASGDRTYFRVSLQDYRKATARARYQLRSTLQLTATFSLLDNQNPASTVNYDFLSRSASLGAYWTPAGAKRISVLGEYTRSTLRSDIDYLIPQTLASTRSFYRDNAHSATSLVEFRLPDVHGAAPRLSLGGSLLVSSGSRRTDYYQPQGRFSLPLHKQVQWYAEWRYYGLSEPYYLYEGFRTHLYLTGLRLSR